MNKNTIIILSVTILLFVIYSFVQKGKQDEQELIIQEQHQIIKDLSIDLKNCEAREKVLIDITGSSII